MSRIALFIFAFFASIMTILAAPVPVADGQLVELDRRITHQGRVRSRMTLEYTPQY